MKYLGVYRYITSDFSAKSQDPYVVSRWPIAAMRMKVKEMVQSKEIEGLSWTSVFCGGFFDWYVLNLFLQFK